MTSDTACSLRACKIMRPVYLRLLLMSTAAAANSPNRLRNAALYVWLASI